MVNEIGKQWGKRPLAGDLMIAVLITGLITILYVWGPWGDAIDKLLNGNRATLYGVIASIAGALLGFSITVTSIVLGIWQSPRLKLVRQSPASPQVWQTFSATNHVLAIATGIALLCLVFDRDTSPVRLLAGLLIILVGVTTARLWRTIWVLDYVIKIVSTPVARGVASSNPSEVV